MFFRSISETSTINEPIQFGEVVHIKFLINPFLIMMKPQVEIIYLETHHETPDLAHESNRSAAVWCIETSR